jgi:hypothetical protein
VVVPVAFAADVVGSGRIVQISCRSVALLLTMEAGAIFTMAGGKMQLRLALDLAVQPEMNFLELARHLRDIRDANPGLLAEFVRRSGMSPRKAYYLAAISEQLDGFGFPRRYLEAIGWTKLQIVAQRLSDAGGDPVAKEIVEDWLSFAKSHTARDLRNLLLEVEQIARPRCVLMYFNADQYKTFEDAFLKHGGKRQGRGLLSKEEVVIQMIKSLEALSAPSQDALNTPKGSKHKH